MTRSRRFAALTLGMLLAVGSAPAHADSGPADFDFNLGHWKSRIHLVLRPLSDTPESNDMTGAVSVRKLWDGGLLEEIEADGAKGHWEGLSLFLYNPTTRQWSQFFANSRRGVLAWPPSVGGPTGDRVQLYSSDTAADGRTILVRTVWSQLKRDSHRYDEHQSEDGGKTWKPSFGADLVHSPTPAVAPSIALAQPGEVSHDFDFELGKWKLETRRLTHPLTHSNEWTNRTGEMEAVPVWGGRANLAHLKAESPTGRVEMAALRLYNPKAKQWSIYFATPQAGMLGLPLIGEFKAGRGEFYDQEEFNGRTIWVRISIFPTSPTTTQTEQAFSDDQGKTWETNMVTRFTRIPD